MKTLFRCGVALVALCAVSPVSAQKPPAGYPEKPIRVIIPYPPGGGSDVVFRAMATQLSASLGRQVAIDNRAGGAAMIGTEMVAKAPPDGYTLLVTTQGPLTINPALFPKMAYDPIRDFVPVSLLASYGSILTTHPSVPVRNVKQLIAFAKARPGQIQYASGGNGTTQHLSGELLKFMTGIDIVHVPYKGGGPAFIDLMGGHVSMSFATPGLVLPYLNSGKLNVLAISTAKRAPAFPQVPTVGETLPGFEAVAWIGLLAPRGTPRDIVNLLHRESVKVLQSPEVKSILAAQNFDVAGNNPDEFAAYMKEDLNRWSKVIKAAGIQANN